MNAKVFFLALFLCLAQVGYAQDWNSEDVSTGLIVQFKQETKPDPARTLEAQAFVNPDLQALSETYGLQSIKLIGNRKEVTTYTLTFDQKITRKMVSAYQDTDLFAVVEPDFVCTVEGVASTLPNDANFNLQWCHRNTGSYSFIPSASTTAGADMDSDLAWDITQGSTSTVVAILDSGIKPDHPEFGGRIWQNSGESQDGTDSDNNGFADDTQLGWDFVNNDNDPTDDHGHGTSVAGVAVGTGNNTTGLAGLNWFSQIMACKITDSNNSGNYSDMIDGIYYAVDNGADVINLSVSGSASSSILEQAVDYAYNNDVPLVVSSGNTNGAVRFPGRYANSIAVGSSEADDTRSGFSNFGPELDYVAPGRRIAGLDYLDDNDYTGLYTGTSYAAPQVAGIISLLLAVNPSLTVDQIRTIMEDTSEDQVGDSFDTPGRDDYYGYGRVNAYQALLQASPEIAVAVAPSSALENSGTNFSFTFSSSVTLSLTATVAFSISGSASSSTDFTLSGESSFNTMTGTGTITIPQGSNSAALTVTPIGDAVVEPDETVIVTIENP